MINLEEQFEKFGPKTVFKGWGREEWIVNNEHENYCSKFLFFDIGKRCSFHYHVLKHETFHAIRGHFIIKLSYHNDIRTASDIHLWPGGSLVIPRGLRHQIINAGSGPGKLLETSTFHRDEDSYRIIKGD